jgi:hypothetical protein
VARKQEYGNVEESDNQRRSPKKAAVQLLSSRSGRETKVGGEAISRGKLQPLKSLTGGEAGPDMIDLSSYGEDKVARDIPFSRITPYLFLTLTGGALLALLLSKRSFSLRHPTHTTKLVFEVGRRGAVGRGTATHNDQRTWRQG